MPRHLEGHDSRGGMEARGRQDGPATDALQHGDSADNAADPQSARESPAPPPPPAQAVQRVQTGVRMEKRLVKVLKALAELYDSSLGDLLEGIVLHAFEGRSPFSAESLRRIAELERIYGLDLDSRAGRLSRASSSPAGGLEDGCR
jgi:hypothetical protein